MCVEYHFVSDALVFSEFAFSELKKSVITSSNLTFSVLK